ncbi:MAG: galactonate dehydratase, partial [Candidatus Latescibacterota bacterium]
YTKRDESEANAIYKCAYKREGGYIPIPQAPGLGVELDDALIEQTPFAPLTNINTPLRNDGSVAYSV